MALSYRHNTGESKDQVPSHGEQTKPYTKLGYITVT